MLSLLFISRSCKPPFLHCMQHGEIRLSLRPSFMLNFGFVSVSGNSGLCLLLFFLSYLLLLFEYLLIDISICPFFFIFFSLKMILKERFISVMELLLLSSSLSLSPLSLTVFQLYQSFVSLLSLLLS